MKYTDFYGLLEISSLASATEIRRAYRQQAKRYHPDTHPGDPVAEKHFKAIQEAYEVLSDPHKRARFDQLTRNWSQYQSFDDVVEDLSKEPTQEEEPPFTRPKQDADAMFEANFGDFYDTFFGSETASFWQKRGQPVPGPDPMEISTEGDESDTEEAGASAADTGFAIEYTTHISLEEACKGTKRRIQIHEGTLKTIEVTIPAGVITGSKVHIQREMGDFYLVIQLDSHEVFRPEGHDLYRDLHIMDYEALLGTKKTVSTLTGTLQMNLPAGASAGKTFRIRGHGLPELKDPTVRGDLYVQLKVDVSQDLSPEEQDLIRRFRDLRVSRQTTV